MERSRLGKVFILIGAILFVFSLFIVLLQFNLYLISLFAMFFSVVIIAIGFAYAKGIESSTSTPD